MSSKAGILYSTSNLEYLMATESSGKKCCLAISSAIHLCYVFLAGIILCVWWGNQNKIAEMSAGKGNFYDQLPAFYYTDEALKTEYYGSNTNAASAYF